MKLRGRIAAIRATVSSQPGDVPGIIQHASKALDVLPEQDLTWRSLAAMALGDAYSYMGDMAASYQARSETVRVCQATGVIYYVITANLKLASTLRAQGRLGRTLEICRQQMQPASAVGLSQTHIIGCLLAIWGEVLAESGDLDGAIRQTRIGIELTESGVNLGTFAYSHLCLMRVLFSRGDLDDAEEIVRKIEKTALESDMPHWFMNQMSIWQARIWLAQGKLAAASQWAEERGLNAEGEPLPLPRTDFYSLFETIMLARILIAQSRWDEATGLLQRLLEPAEAGGRKARRIEILLLQALTAQAAGDTIQAMAALRRALALAEPEGFIQTFVDEGPPMAHLLYEALSRGIAPDYVRRLLAAFPMAEPEHGNASKAPTPESELIEPLSEREIDVLQLIAEGLTNPEVASRLYLSPNTVKAHTRNIYGKLGVSNRMRATARARALGILPPD